MADTDTFVILSDGDTYDTTSQSRVIVIDNTEVLKNIEDGAYENADEFVQYASQSYPISELLRVAYSAAEYIRALNRGQLLEWIAEAGENLVNDLSSNGFLTPDEREQWFADEPTDG